MEGDSIETKTKEEYVNLIVKLKLIAHEIAEADLWITYHILDDALTQIGWEVADKLDNKDIVKPLRAKAYPHQLYKDKGELINASQMEIESKRKKEKR